MLELGHLDPHSTVPLYRQIYSRIRHLVESGEIANGHRLPPTRELAGSLGLNRTTVAAAYELLEADGFLRGHVGRGTFIHKPGQPAPHPRALISFSTSRPSEQLFPMASFRETCVEVIQSEQAQGILQLGSPSGYAPLRQFLLTAAAEEGAARETDDILITSGCQQAFDLIQRTLTTAGDTILIEDPVIPGLRNVFERAGTRLIGIPVGEYGIDLPTLERVAAREHPKLIVVTPNFQNPTGATLPLDQRQSLVTIARSSGAILIENDIYGQLRYAGDPLPTLKQLDDSGNTVLLRSFSKLAFPGLRVGWVIGLRGVIARLTETKQWSDLHTDQLSQAVLFRFAQSGRLEKHRQNIVAAGRERLHAALSACERHLPAGAVFTRPHGGMNLWVRLPDPLDSAELLPAAERAGVTYLPGKFFGVSRIERAGLRISFAGLSPAMIESGISILGRIFLEELDRDRSNSSLEALPAMV